MTRLLALVLALLAGTPVIVPTASAATPISAALPPGAQIVATLAVSPDKATTAVVYRTGDVRLGVVVAHSRSAHLLWSRSLPAGSIQLKPAGYHNVFVALVSRTRSAGDALFSYQVGSSAIRSAIAGHPGGEVSGDEGISFRQTTFAVRAHDRGHVGSVAYRIVRRFQLTGGRYTQRSLVRVPDYAPASYPVPNGVIHSADGNVTLIRLEVAATEQERETGLMYRKSLDPDSGMVFVWTAPVFDSFWMENTYVPLTVAFLGSDGTIQEMQDMQPLTETLHTPGAPYQYAIEVNQGFFAQHGIKVGDRVELHLSNET